MLYVVLAYISIIIQGWYALLHPFYLSMTELRYQAQNRTLEISVRIFSDDLEKALKNQCHCFVDILNPEKQAVNDVHLKNYLNKHLQIYLNGKRVEAEWLGFENEQESTWAYLEVKNVPKGVNILIMNDILYELLNEQVNLVRFKSNGMDKTWQLRKPEQRVEIIW